MTETTEEETDPMTEALKKEKEKAELKQAIAEAEKATLAAKLPETEGSGVEGSVTFGEGTGYFAEVLAYKSLRAAAVKIAKAAGKPSPSDNVVLVVTGDELAGKAQLWEIVRVRVDDAQKKLKGLLEKYEGYGFGQPERRPEGGLEAVALTTALTTATAVLSAATDIASFFRSDLTVTARKVEIPTGALATAVAGELATRGWKPRLPSASLQQTQLMAAIDGLLEVRRRLVARRTDLEADYWKRRQKIKADLDRPRKSLADLEGDPLGDLKTRWDRVAGEIDANRTATDELVKALTEGADGKPSVVEAVAAVDVAKESPDVPILRLDLVGQGGEMHERKSAWRTRVTYVGGVSAEYRWMDQSGHVEKAGVVSVPRARSLKARDFEF